MKVSDVMERHVEFVTSDTKVIDAARIIFGRRINGLPVCKDKKVIGFIAETDILSKFHPTIQEFAEDPFLSSNFEKMEEKGQEILNLTVKDIMNKKPITVNTNDPILRADSLMRLEDVGRLPVINDKGNLVGIVAMGDIFKSLVGRKMPYLEGEEYHDWIAKHFDLSTGWESRIPSEIPPLAELFRRKEVEKILDIGCGTGEHAIALAKNGFQVVGLENSRAMFTVSQTKWRTLPKNLQSKIKFIQGDYIKKLKKIKEEYQAAIFMGNAMAHIHNSYQGILKELGRILSKKKSVIVSQLINSEKAIKTNNRLYRFVVRQSGLSSSWQHAYFWFYDPPLEKGGLLTLNAGILDFDGRRWSVRGMNAVQTIAFTKKSLGKVFEAIDFPEINFYGSRENEPLLRHKFDIKRSVWLNVVAER